MCKNLNIRLQSAPARCQRSWATETGAELVEAAFILPLLLTLLFGIFWIGRAYNVYQTITRAAREGARVAVAPSCATCGNSFPSNSSVTSAINDALQAASLDPANVSPAISITRQLVLNPTDPAANRVQGIVITFGYPFKLVIPFTPVNLTQITINTKVQMRQEF
jgi:Flp pilus assembly protein TadG